jgi:hypothetical protein
MGGMIRDRDGLVLAGAITAGVGLAAVAPGVWLIVTSGSRAEVQADGVPVARGPRGLAIEGSF